jgi:iron complex transport system substrate-binding protein
MRLVSLCPSLTELLFDLGAGDDLVGRTRFCVHPADRVPEVEPVGGTKTPKIDRIIELAPDIVFMNQEENRFEDARALEAAGIRVFATLPRTPGETAAMVRRVAAAVGHPARGERIARDIEDREERVRRAAEEASPVRFACLIWRNPWMTVNGDTYADSLFALAGGVNVFGDLTERYPVVTPEDLTAVNPDLVILPDEPFPFREKHVEELVTLTGLSRERFRLADGELLSWHGPRTPAGIDYAERLIRGPAKDA